MWWLVVREQGFWETNRTPPPPSRPRTEAPPPGKQKAYEARAGCRRGEREREKKRMFFPPVSFSLVEEGLYRSALPNEINYPFLERLGLKTIIYLYPDDDIDAQL